MGGYAGTTLGVFFPDFDEDSDIFSGSDTDINNGLGGSLFGGVKLNRYLATDLEFSFFGGDIDSDLDVDDENYTVTSIFLNPRFILPLNNNDNSLDLFLSPGSGFSTLVSSVEDEVGDFDSTTTIEDDTRFAWQVKGGASIPISSRFSILGQLRYASQTGDDAIDYFATEVGVEFDF
ncbi:MAG: outer membrane beta-barrel protein [Pleurocapsa sp.]